MLDAAPLSPDLAFGSMVRGLTLAQLDQQAVREALRALWLDRGVLVFRGGDASVDFQIELSKVFGPLVRHQQGDRLVEGRPELLWLRSDPANAITAEVDGRLVVGLLPWHGDARWLAEPPHGAILRVHRAPSTGGETGFIDLISTYERLPDDLKQRIEHLEAEVRFSSDPKEIFRFQPHHVRVLDNGSAARDLGARTDFPPIIQPLVYLQPETGRKVLGFTPMPRQKILGLSEEDSEALLHSLARHTTDERYAYFHRYQPDDLVLWDNLRMLHCALGIAPGDEREIWRTTIAPADYPIARAAEDGGFAWTSAEAI
jgi:taurine dioxygenase